MTIPLSVTVSGSTASVDCGPVHDGTVTDVTFEYAGGADDAALRACTALYAKWGSNSGYLRTSSWNPIGPVSLADGIADGVVATVHYAAPDLFVDGVAIPVDTITLDEVRAWIQVPATILDDPLLQQVLDAELLLQARACRIPPEGLTPAHRQAIYRRVGREVAARGIPLGMLGADSEYGPRALARWDAEIDRLEGPYRMVVFG